MEPIVLSALSDNPIELHGEDGQVWKLTASMKAIEAVRLLQDPTLPSQAQSDRTELEWFAVILSRSMKRFHPEMTPERCLEEFAAVHLVEAVVSFLLRLGQIAAEGRTVIREANLALERAQTTRATTPPPESS